MPLADAGACLQLLLLLLLLLMMMMLAVGGAVEVRLQNAPKRI